MPLLARVRNRFHFSAITAVSISFTAASAALSGVATAAVWVSVPMVALADDQSAAVETGIIASVLWVGRWLGGKGMVFLLDAMLTQRERHQGRHAPTERLRVLR